MPSFFYTATSFRGEKISGREFAKDERELARILRQKGLIPILITLQEKKPFWKIDLGTFTPVSLTEKLMFVRNLRVMIGAGVSLPQALEILEKQTENQRLKKIILDLKEKVLKGNPLSLAMESYRAIFPELFTNMIKVGEESGTLEQVLSHLALQLEKQYELRSQIIGALIYPAVVITAMVLIAILMLVLVVPQLAKTFQDLNINLPFTTRFIIGLGTFFEERWYLFLLVLAVMTFASLRLLRTDFGKAIFGKFSLKLPVIGKLVQKANSALTARTLSSLIGAGVPIVRSLEITATILGDPHYKNILLISAEAVRKGSKLSETIGQYPNFYPPLVAQMIGVGEETGKTSEVLGKLADFFEDEVTQVTKNLTSLLEPILMLIIGGVVGFFAVSMLQPMYSLLNALQQP